MQNHTCGACLLVIQGILHLVNLLNDAFDLISSLFASFIGALAQMCNAMDPVCMFSASITLSHLPLRLLPGLDLPVMEGRHLSHSQAFAH